MGDLSQKATIIVNILEQLDAKSNEKRTNIYAILDKLETVNLKDILPNEEDYELDCLRCEMTQKSVSTTLASLNRKGVVYKTGVTSVKVNGENKNIRCYYLIDNCSE